VLATIAVTVLAAQALSGCARGHSPTIRSFTSESEGVAIRYPAGWLLTTRNDSYVPDPALCLDLKPKNSRRVDLRIVEYLPPYLNRPYLDLYLPRPTHFHLDAFQRGDEDWSPPKATVFQFRENRRVFMVGLLRPKKTNEALAGTVERILDSFDVAPHGRCRPTSGVGSHGVPKP
jgi:hypothetical protein